MKEKANLDLLLSLSGSQTKYKLLFKKLTLTIQEKKILLQLVHRSLGTVNLT